MMLQRKSSNQANVCPSTKRALSAKTRVMQKCGWSVGDPLGKFLPFSDLSSLPSCHQSVWHFSYHPNTIANFIFTRHPVDFSVRSLMQQSFSVDGITSTATYCNFLDFVYRFRYAVSQCSGCPLSPSVEQAALLSTVYLQASEVNGSSSRVRS